MGCYPSSNPTDDEHANLGYHPAEHMKSVGRNDPADTVQI